MKNFAQNVSNCGRCIFRLRDPPFRELAAPADCPEYLMKRLFPVNFVLGHIKKVLALVYVGTMTSIQKHKLK
jgi:hypothetical protein